MIELPKHVPFDCGIELACPVCGDPNGLHHTTVEVFNRASEDREDGVHAVVDQHGVQIKTSMERNPSSRRDGVIIHTTCEQCETAGQIILVQHKGMTYLSAKPGVA